MTAQKEGFNQKEMDDFAKKAVPLLRDHGYIPKKTQEYEYNYSAIWIAVAFIIGLMISGAFFYSSYKGWLKSDVSSTCPDITIPPAPSCPSLNYSCSDVTCPVCPSFPSNLTIRIINST